MSAEDGLTAQECQGRIDQFVEVTSTDEAFAQSILQEHEWSLESAINAYFRQSIPEGAQITTKPPDLLSFITWNIDGLDEKNLVKRVTYVIDQIKRIKPDVVMLQEVIIVSLKSLERELDEYIVIKQEGGDSSGYFTCALFRKTTIYLDDFATKNFDNSVMGRGMQIIRAHVGKVKLCFINVHLESTKDYGQQRCMQMEECIDIIKNVDESVTVIFAGDMNIRDSEIAGLNNGSGLPYNVQDVWEQLGKRTEVRYTWDCSRNTNLQFPGKFKPRCRFDRILIRDSNPKNAKAKTFNLIGLEKVPGTQSFASDHWGLLASFDLRHTE